MALAAEDEEDEDLEREELVDEAVVETVFNEETKGFVEDDDWVMEALFDADVDEGEGVEVLTCVEEMVAFLVMDDVRIATEVWEDTAEE